MKKTAMVLFLVAVVLSAAWVGAASAFVLSVDITSLSAGVGGSETITVNDGTAPYTAVSNDESVATVVVAANVVTWTGVSEGTASITIDDSDGNSVIAAVTVSGAAPPGDTELSMVDGDPLSLSMSEKERRTVPVVDGSGFYNFTLSAEGVAEVEISGNSLTVIAESEGNVTVTVTDSAGNEGVVEIAVSSLVSISPGSLTVARGETGTLTVARGSGYYNVTSSDTGIAEASLSAGGTVTVTALEEGTAEITVTDSLGNTAESLVNVVEELRILSFITDSGTAVSTSVTTFEGKEETLTLRDGSGFYDVTTSDENVAKGYMGGDDLVVTAVTAGTAEITVTDSTGKTVVAVVTVKQVLVASVEELMLQAGTKGTFTVSNTNNLIKASTSNSSVARALWSEGVVTVTAFSPGSATITVSENDVSVDTVAVTVVNLFAPLLSVSVAGESATLSWPEVSGATGYRLSAVTSLDAPESLVTADLGNVDSVTYEFFSGFDRIAALQAYNDSGDSDYSNTVNILIP